MSNTTHFRQLMREIPRLKPFLPKSEPFGKYTDLQIRKMIAFRVLGHAALETYFENVSEELLGRCHSRWLRLNHAHPLLLSLCMRFAKLGAMPENQYLQKQKGNLTLLVKDAHDWHARTIAENHGVREENLKSLFIPYGSTVWALIEPLCIYIDPYAVLRGEYAHRAPSGVTVPNPVDELATVTDLTAKVKTMDQRIYGMLQNL